MHKGYIAVIGTRELPEEAWCTVTNFVTLLCSYGYSIRTGAAPGTDNAAMFAADAGQIVLCLPRPKFEEDEIARLERIKGPVEKIVYQPMIHTDWTESVQRYHPAAGRLTRGSIALHARNCGIVAPSRVTVAFPEKVGSGGTGQGIRVARGLGVPVIECPLVGGRKWNLVSLVSETFGLLGETEGFNAWSAATGCAAVGNRKQVSEVALPF